MRLKKGKHSYKLRKPIGLLDSACVETGKVGFALCLVTPMMIDDMIKKHPDVTGIPAYMSLRDNTVYVHPAPAENFYRLRLRYHPPMEEQ